VAENRQSVSARAGVSGVRVVARVVRWRHHVHGIGTSRVAMRFACLPHSLPTCSQHALNSWDALLLCLFMTIRDDELDVMQP